MRVLCHCVFVEVMLELIALNSIKLALLNQVKIKHTYSEIKIISSIYKNPLLCVYTL